MAALVFPTSPATDQIYSANDRSWRWDGVSWNAERIPALNPASSPWCRAAWVPYLESYANNDPISSLTDQSGRGLTISAAGSVRPLFITNQLNGKAIARFDGTDDYLQCATAADFKFLHDGHNLTIFILVKQSVLDPNELAPLLDTAAFGSSTTGVSIYLDDRAASSQSNSLWISVAKGSAGNFVINASAQNVMQPPTWQLITIQFSASRYSLEDNIDSVYDMIAHVDGMPAVGAGVANLPHGTGNPTNKLTIGASSALATHFAAIDLAGIWILDQRFTPLQVASYHRWISETFGISVTNSIAPYGYNGFGAIVKLSDSSLLCAWNALHRHDTVLASPIVSAKSIDKGISWSTTKQISTGDATHGNSDTGLFRTAANTILCYYYIDDATNIASKVRRSTDNGVTWGSEITPTSGMTLVYANSGGMIQLSNGHILWPLFGRSSGSLNKATCVKSTDDGLTFGSEVTILDLTGTSKTIGEPRLIKISGTYPTEVLHSYMRNDTDSKIVKCVSTDSGATWGANSDVKTSCLGRPAVCMAASGVIYLCCRRTTGNKQGVIFWSSDSGTTWSTNAYTIDCVIGFNTYSDIFEIEAGKLMILTSSEFAAQITSTTSGQSSLRCRIHNEAEIQRLT